MEWIVTEVDGKVASIATDYRHLPHIAAEIAKLPAEETFSLGTRKISTGELLEFAQYLTWEDLRLFRHTLPDESLEKPVSTCPAACTATPSWLRWRVPRRACGPWPMWWPSTLSHSSSPAT